VIDEQHEKIFILGNFATRGKNFKVTKYKRHYAAAANEKLVNNEKKRTKTKQTDSNYHSNGILALSQVNINKR
jgi:hypothetical protein